MAQSNTDPIDKNKVKWDDTPQIDTSKVSWDTTPVVASTTKAPVFPKRQAPQGRTLVQSLRSLLPIPGTLIPSIIAEPQKQQLEDVANFTEYGLPLLSAPVGGWPGVLAMMALQGTGSSMAESMRGLAENRPTSLKDLGEAFNRGSLAAGLGGITGMGLATAAQKLVSPFASKVDIPTAELGKKYDIPLTAGAISKAKAPSALEALAERGLFGGKIGQKIEAGSTRLNEITDDMVSRLGASTEKLDIGQTLQSGMQDFEKTFNDTKDAIYGQVEQMSGDARLNLSEGETANRLRAVIDDLNNVVGKKPAVLPYLQSKLQGLDPKSQIVSSLMRSGASRESAEALFKDAEFIGYQQGAGGKRLALFNLKHQLGNTPEGGTVTAETIRNLGGTVPPEIPTTITYKQARATLQDINNKINFRNPNPIVGGYEGRLKHIAEGLSNDIDKQISAVSPELKSAIDEANNFYKENINKLNSVFGKKINTFIQQGKASELPKYLLSPSTPVEWIPKTYQLVGEEGKRTLQATTLEKIFNTAKAKTPEAFLTPQGLERQIKSYGDERLTAMFGPETTSKLKDISKLAYAIGKGQKISGGSQTAFLGRLGFELIRLGVAPLRALKFLGSDYVVSKFIESEVGQRWLTEGFKIYKSVPQVLGQTARMGAVKAIPPAAQKAKDKVTGGGKPTLRERNLIRQHFPDEADTLLSGK